MRLAKDYQARVEMHRKEKVTATYSPTLATCSSSTLPHFLHPTRTMVRPQPRLQHSPRRYSRPTLASHISLLVHRHHFSFPACSDRADTSKRATEMDFHILRSIFTHEQSCVFWKFFCSSAILNSDAPLMFLNFLE